MSKPEQAIGQDPTLMQTDRSLLDAESATIVADSTLPSRPQSERLPRGSSIGRYVVLEELGAGGMGVVYAAYDPELDRKIAIKVLLPAQPTSDELSGGKARLIREAQALARLSHPNVVNVHDVGEVDGRVFVAMEHIDGGTLKQWLDRSPRSIPEILAVFIEAGRGLAAAHAAGLVHRDFKPDNVLVGIDGRARVVDFGLARGQTGRNFDSDSVDDSGTSSYTGSRLDSELTAVGTVMGTPAYMAPEQHVGGPADAATDQFSFSVALYKALYGERPFHGGSVRALARAVCRGKIRPAPAGTKVPAWLRRVVIKGLSVLPEDRHESIAAMLEELAHDPSIARRRHLMLGMGVVLVGGVAAGAYFTGARDKELCASSDDAIEETWNKARRSAVKESFAATELPYADDTFGRVATVVDDYVESWAAGAREACEATRVQQTQSEELLDRRTACLDGRRARLDALLEVFAHADASVVERAMSAVLGLPAVSSCSDLDALGRGVAPPSSEAQRARVDALSVELERAAAIHSTGRYKEALELREAAVKKAEEIGYAPTLALAVHQLSITQGALAMPEGTETTHRAFALALEAGDDTVASRTAADIAQEEGLEHRDAVAARRWADVADSIARRKGGDIQVEMSTLNVRAVTAIKEGDYNEAQRMFETMLERTREEEEAKHNLSVVLMNLGVFHVQQGELDAARSYLEQAAEHVAATEGPKHPSMLDLRSKLGVVSLMATDYEAAQKILSENLELQLAHFGEQHPAVAFTMGGLGVAKRHLDQIEEAERLQSGALEIRRKVYGPDHELICESLRNLALVREDRDDPEGALAFAEEALAMSKRLESDEDPMVVMSELEVGRQLANLERWTEAKPHLETAVAGFEKLPKERPKLVETLLELGRVQRGLGDPEAALETFERGRKIAKREAQERLEAWCSVEAAATLKVLDREPERMRKLAERSRGVTISDTRDRAALDRRAAEILGE